MASSGLAPGFSERPAALEPDHVAALAAGDFDVVGLLQLLHEIGERIGAVRLLVERGIELQHGALQQARAAAALRGVPRRRARAPPAAWPGRGRAPPACCDAAAAAVGAAVAATGSCCCGGLSLRSSRSCRSCRSRTVLPVVTLAAIARTVVDHGFVSDEFVTVLLQDGARKGPAADHEDALVVLLQLVDQRDEIAVATDNRERVDVVVGEGHLECIEGQVDVGAVLVAARGGVTLNHLHGVLAERACSGFLPAPVCVRKLGDDFAAFLERVEHGRYIEFAMQRALHADFDIVEIDEDGDLQFLFHSQFPYVPAPGARDRLGPFRQSAGWPPPG